MNYYSYPRAEMLDFIPENCTQLLDIGCGAGAFGELVKKQRKNVTAWGIEPNIEAATKAEQKLDHVYCGFFDEAANLPTNTFDVITFNDSLEHFIEPYSPLNLAKKLVNTTGLIIVSIPNFRYIENIKHILLEKDFQYTEEGILDKTHLRFFTHKSIIRLFNDIGLDIIKIQGINPHWWSGWKIFLLRNLFNNYVEDMKYLQYVVVCKPL